MADDWFAQNARKPRGGDDWFSSNSPQQASSRAVATGTIAPMPTGVTQWIKNLESDVRLGTGSTLPGRVLQKLGAPGLESGTTPAVADTVASPILGPIKTAQGVSEVRSSPLRGAADIVSGLAQTATIPASFVSPQIAESAVSKIPSVAREQAGELFSSIAHDANKVPINLQNSQGAIDRLMDWAKTTNLGPTLNKFLNRITAPNKGPITYEEAKKFQTILSDLSANEKMNLAAPIKREVAGMLSGLKQDIAQSLGSRGPDYLRAMSQYHYGAQAQSAINVLKSALTKAAIAGGLGAGGAAGYDIYKKLTQ